MDYESSSPVDEMENAHAATAQPLVSSTSMLVSKDQHEPLSFGAPVTDTMETSSPIVDHQYHIVNGHPLDDDSGIDYSAQEWVDAEGTIREEELAHILPTIPYEPHIPTNTEAPSMSALKTSSMAAGHSHTLVPQFPSQEEDVYEVQDDAHYDVDSAYDADSIRDNDTKTLASFITKYRWENGRRYHAYSDGAYWVWLQKQSEDYLYQCVS
jgi:hypothetical protein